MRLLMELEFKLERSFCLLDDKAAALRAAVGEGSVVKPRFIFMDCIQNFLTCN